MFFVLTFGRGCLLSQCCCLIRCCCCCCCWWWWWWWWWWWCCCCCCCCCCLPKWSPVSSNLIYHLLLGMSPVELLYGRFSSLISEIQIPLKHPQQNPKVFQVDFSPSFCKPSSLQAFDKEGLHPFLQLL